MKLLVKLNDDCEIWSNVDKRYRITVRSNPLVHDRAVDCDGLLELWTDNGWQRVTEAVSRYVYPLPRRAASDEAADERKHRDSVKSKLVEVAVMFHDG